MGFTILFLIFFLILPACTSTRYLTHTKKSGVEQLLVAKAVEGALQGTSLNIKGTKIFIDLTSLAPDENPYMKKAMEHWLFKNGAFSTEDKKEADYIASVLVKCIGTDGSEFNFGLPSLPVPVLNIATPQISFMSSSIQKGYTELEVVIYGSDTGIKENPPPLIGKSYFKRYTIFFIPFSLQNIY